MTSETFHSPDIPAERGATLAQWMEGARPRTWPNAFAPVLVGSAVTYAVMGLDWEQTDEPSPREFDDDTLTRLAELEHRRWAIHQRAAGRQSHKWSKPWAQLDEGTKSYDEHIMRTLPAILGAAGIEVVSA